MNLAIKNPIGNVIKNDIRKAAIWGEIAINPKFKISFSSIKWYEIKYKKISSTVFIPPVAAYLNVCRGINLLKGG